MKWTFRQIPKCRQLCNYYCCAEFSAPSNSDMQCFSCCVLVWLCVSGLLRRVKIPVSGRRSDYSSGIVHTLVVTPYGATGLTFLLLPELPLIKGRMLSGGGGLAWPGLAIGTKDYIPRYFFLLQGETAASNIRDIILRPFVPVLLVSHSQ